MRNVSIVQSNTPTETLNAEEKEILYHQLYVIRKRLSNDDIVIVMLDLNGKLGSDNTFLRQII